MKRGRQPSSAVITVLCADDRREMVNALRAMIDMEDDMVSVGGVHDAADLIKAAKEIRPRVAIVDLSMPGPIPPMEAIRQVAAEIPETRIIAYSGYDDDATRDKVIDAGAWGLISKIADPHEVIEAVRRVAAGELAA